MSEIAEDFCALREARQEKRRENTERSTALLNSRGVAFVSKNAGAHLIVSHRGVIVDFWPATGLWIPRDTRHPRGRGVKPLLTFLEKVGK